MRFRRSFSQSTTFLAIALPLPRGMTSCIAGSLPFLEHSERNLYRGGISAPNHIVQEGLIGFMESATGFAGYVQNEHTE